MNVLKGAYVCTIFLNCSSDDSQSVFHFKLNVLQYRAKAKNMMQP